MIAIAAKQPTLQILLKKKDSINSFYKGFTDKIISGGVPHQPLAESSAGKKLSLQIRSAAASVGRFKDRISFHHFILRLSGPRRDSPPSFLS